MVEKIFGPYSSCSLDTNEFWGFDENDDSLLKFKMDDQIVSAIKKGLRDIDVKYSESGATEGQTMWGDTYNATLEMYHEMFDDCEVIPYVYVLENDVNYGDLASSPSASQEVQAANTRAMSSCGFYKANEVRNEIYNKAYNTTARTTMFNQTRLMDSSPYYKGSGFNDTENGIYASSGFTLPDGVNDSSNFNIAYADGANITSTYTSASVHAGNRAIGYYATHASTYGTTNPKPREARHVTFRKDILTGLPRYTSSEKFPQLPLLLKNTDVKKVVLGINLGKVRDIAENTMIKYRDNVLEEGPGRYAFLDLASKSQLDSNFGDYYTTLSSPIIYNNTNDGSYSADNKRTTIGMNLRTNAAISQKYGTQIPVLASNLTATDETKYRPNTYSGTLVFFVKTFLPYYTDSGEIDDTREAVQYWAFNAQSLWQQTRLDSPGSSQSSYYYPKGSYNYGGGIWNQYFNMNYMGVGIGDTYAVFPPFAKYIVSDTDFFNNSQLVSPFYEYDNCCYNFLSYGDYTQSGINIMSQKEGDFIDFFKRGLGINTANISENYDEVDSTNTDDWTEPDVTPPPGPDNPDVPDSYPTPNPNPNDTTNTSSPDGSDATGAGDFLANTWALTKSNAKSLQGVLVDNSFWSNISNFFKDNPQQGVISLIRLPFNILGDTEESVTILGDVVGDNVKGIKLTSTTSTKLDMGYIDIPEKFGSFLDYSPYTKITIYLPFIGFKTLDTNSVMGRRITVSYDVDYTDGSCLAVLRISGDNKSGKINTVLDSFNGVIGETIPLSKTDTRDRIQNAMKGFITAGAGLAVGAVTGGVGGAGIIAAGAGSAISTASTIIQKPTYSGQGIAQGIHSAAISYDMKPYIIIERPIVNELDDVTYRMIKGRPSNFYSQLKDVKGFTVCDRVRLNFPCLEEEAKEIKRLLESGVIINVK